MAKFTAIAAILFLLGRAISYFSPNSIFSILEGLGTLGLLIALPYYAVLLIKRVKDRWLWKVRSKIIVSYAFIGIIPLMILGVLLWLTMRLVLGQLAALYLDDELQKVSEQLQEANRQISLHYYQNYPGVAPGNVVDVLRGGAQSHVAELSSGLGPVSWMLLQGGAGDSASTGDEGKHGTRVAAAVPSSSGTSAPALPDWTLKGFTGLVYENERLFFRSVAPLKSGNLVYYNFLELPFADDLMSHIRNKTSLEISPPVRLTAGQNLDVGISGFVTGSQINYIGFILPRNWSSGEVATHLSALRVPLRTVYDHYFTETSTLGSGLIVIFYLLGGLFILVEITSLVVASAIARSITRTIHNLDAATAAIQAGNFEYRIETENRDQLEAMAASFNKMSDSIMNLMREVSEKQRLDKEIEIAREVQSKLFPQKLPSIPGCQLAAACLAARQVSGDYYDFIPSGTNVFDIVIGDISGKGISAALLMASLQSSIRTIISYQAIGSGNSSVAHSVADINRQLYHQTSPDKFATLVLSRLNANDMTLTYCNAGHNPPLVIANGATRHLSKGGMVAGLFEDPEYDEEIIQLQPKDVVVFYTDGIVEAENPDGEQFGEDRLADLMIMNSFLTADDMQALILDQLSCWVAGGDQRDDMTVVIVKMD